jgi:outer membrane biosynthesis protein TonB
MSKHIALLLLFALTAAAPALAVETAACDLPAAGAIPIRRTHTYPDDLKNLPSPGKVIFAVSMKADGSPEEVDVTKPSGLNQIDAMLREHVQSHWRWTPPSASCSSPWSKVHISFVWGWQRIPLPASTVSDVVLTPGYPADILTHGEQGAAQIALLVSGDGEMLSSKLTQRSGIANLDELSLQLATNHDWSAQLKGKTSPTSIQVRVEWKRPQ